MKVTANAQQVAAEILEAFKSGAVPKALALTFLTRHLDSPCSRWSWRNRLIVALRGHADARGFRQWRQVGRHVRSPQVSRTLPSRGTTGLKSRLIRNSGRAFSRSAGALSTRL